MDLDPYKFMQTQAPKVAPARMLQFTKPSGKVITAAVEVWIAAVMSEFDSHQQEKILNKIENINTRLAISGEIIPRKPLSVGDIVNGKV